MNKDPYTLTSSFSSYPFFFLISILQKRSAKQFDHVVKMNDELKMKVNSIKSTRAEQEPEIVRVNIFIVLVLL